MLPDEWNFGLLCGAWWPFVFRITTVECINFLTVSSALIVLRCQQSQFKFSDRTNTHNRIPRNFVHRRNSFGDEGNPATILYMFTFGVWNDQCITGYWCCSMLQKRWSVQQQLTKTSHLPAFHKLTPVLSYRIDSSYFECSMILPFFFVGRWKSVVEPLDCKNCTARLTEPSKHDNKTRQNNGNKRALALCTSDLAVSSATDWM